MSVNSRYPTPWKPLNQLGRAFGIILLILGVLIKLPGLGVWLAVMFAVKAWPAAEQFMMTVGMDAKPTLRAQKIETHKQRGFSFINPIVLGIGDPGETEDHVEDWKEPLRLSSIMNILVALSLSWLVVRLPIHELILQDNLPLWGWYWEIPLFIINVFFFYINLQQIAGSYRQFKDIDPEAIHPPVHYDSEIRESLERNDYIKMGLAFLFPLIGLTALTFFGTSSLFDFLLWFPSIITIAFLFPIAIFWKLSKPIIHEHFEYILAQKKKWSEWWDFLPAYKGMSPTYIFEQNAPDSAPTHKVVTFGVSGGEAGVKPFMKEEVVKGLMTLLQGTDTILVGTYPKMVGGAHEVETSQENAFKIAYPLEPGGHLTPDGGNMDSPTMIGSKYHLRKDVDPTTRSFYAHAALQNAFRSLKIQQPIFVSANALTKPDSENTIIETKWNIEEAGLSYNKLYQSTIDIQNELGVKWLRVGRRPEGSYRAEEIKPARLVSIVYSIDGKSPLDDGAEFQSPKNVAFAHGLEWSWQMTSLKIPEMLSLNVKAVVQDRINMMAWRLPEGVKYEDIARHAEAIQEKMGVEWLRVTVPSIDFGENSPANIVYFYYGENPSTSREPMKFRNRKDEAKVKGLNWIHTLRTADWKYFGIQLERTIDHSAKKDGSLLEAIWHLPQGLVYVDILKQRDRIAEKFGTPYFEIYRRSAIPKTASWIDDSYASFIFGQEPSESTVNGTEVSYKGVAPKSAKYINMVYWGTAFKKVDLMDSDGTAPIATGNIEKPLGVTVTTFRKIGKLSEDDFEKRLPNLKTALGVNHLKIDYTKEAAAFTVEHAPKDPLSNNFDYDDYKDVLLLPEPPEPGQGKIEFGLGIGTTGEIVEMDFEGSPHICIGASSGSGKSYLLRAILLSWMHNNHPEKDLWMLMIEPKKGLEGYAKYPHVKCFIGNDTPAYQNVPELTDDDTGIQEVDPLIVGAYDIYDWLTEEMKRRELVYKRYEQEWGVRIEKLPEARQAAMQHMEENNLEDHELFMPFIVLVAEEAPQFMRELRTGGSVGKAKAGMVNDIRRISEAVSQRARATGIILLNVSQNFKNELFPIEVKNNSRVVGLTTNTPRASINIWGDDTLHNLGKPGRGIKNDPESGTLIDFRAFFVPMGEVEEHDGEKIQMRDYFAENLDHLELRKDALNGWEPALLKMYKPKYAQASDEDVRAKGIPSPSDFVTKDKFTDEF